ncbi:MAG: hypothetical protein JW724_03215 [Candidatus Altiarchaeota archaeon]|nr:hypothetical protein [Candidatus Altiarchaeota archaeon]
MKTVGQIIVAIVISLNLCVIGYTANTVVANHRRDQGNPYADKVEFNRLLVKHGLNCDVAVIYRDPLGPYFIRDGKRCRFD